MNRFAVTSIIVLLLLLGFIAVAPPTMYASSASSSSFKGCFDFTQNGAKVDRTHCSHKANNIETDFKTGAGGSCGLFFTLDGKDRGSPQYCPEGANDFNVSWNGGFGNVITACTWTHNGHPLSIEPCSVPSDPSATGFNFSSDIVDKVHWTSGGKEIGKITAPYGNGLEFVLKED
jgi:hypothetical protein